MIVILDSHAEVTVGWLATWVKDWRGKKVCYVCLWFQVFVGQYICKYALHVIHLITPMCCSTVAGSSSFSSIFVFSGKVVRFRFPSGKVPCDIEPRSLCWLASMKIESVSWCDLGHRITEYIRFPLVCSAMSVRSQMLLL